MYSGETLTGRGRPMLRLPATLVGEERLARMAARGERRAFEVVYARYQRELYAYCRAILEEPDEAQDALQNTMAVALRHVPSLERRTSLRGWLYRVAHNEAVSILRRRIAPLDPMHLPESAAPGADVDVERRERVRQVLADLRALPGRQRGALVMRELSDLSYSQIAAALETSEAGARQLVYEARESLRAVELGRELDCESARRAISERDGRVFRGRRLRAHLAACHSCRDFRAAIDTRRGDLAALFPPLAPAAASGLLASVLGDLGQGGATGASAGAGARATAAIGTAASGALGGVGVKAASIVTVIALGAGAAGFSGGIKPPFRAGDDQRVTTPAPAPTPASRPIHRTPAAGAAKGAPSATAGWAARPAHAPSASAHRPGDRHPTKSEAQHAATPPPTSNAGHPAAAAQSGGPPAAAPGVSPSNQPPEASRSGSARNPSPSGDHGLAQTVVASAQARGNSPAPGSQVATNQAAVAKSTTNP
jgi:RNA polymerase sigma factor (sigma-70 family)